MTTPPSFRSGYIAVVGRPNVGKSTLINHLLGQKIAAVSPRPQTTRRRQLGILTLPDAQAVFIDTPGIHKPLHRLGEYMNDEAAQALENADVILWLLDASTPPVAEDELIAVRLNAQRRLPPVLLVPNKIDRIPAEKLEERQPLFQALRPGAPLYAISAASGAGVEQLLQEVVALLPEGAPFFDPDQVTDFYERDIAVDLIREAALLHLREEIPHTLAVRLDEFIERGEGGARITATILVDRETHKGIVIGRGGEMLKKIGSTARREIETMSGRTVYLELRVKVNKNWRDNPDALRWLGYYRKKEK